MIKVINTPIFYFIRDYFTGDNVAHYLPAKYLWTVCNKTKTGFQQPIYDFKLGESIELDFLFSSEQPQHKYFRKPAWINEYVVAEDEASAREIISKYDYCIDNYRYRGAKPPELNWGHSPEQPAIDLYLVAYTYKAIYEQGIYLDDLELADEYKEYLQSVNQAINPERRPVIALHQRGNDPWNRHLSNSAELSEVLLNSLLTAYPEHQIVLLGESWRFHRHPRIKYLEDHINLHNLRKQFKDYSACLQYVLSAYFCRDADLVFFGISGFSLFVESIRPPDKTPPIPIFWGSKTFTGVDTCMEMLQSWSCSELSDYRKTHPDDAAFQYDVHHFLYYCRNDALLKPYCLDYPNDVDKIFSLLEKMTSAEKHETKAHPLPQSRVESMVTFLWRLKPYIRFVRRVYQVIFQERTLITLIKFKIRARKAKSRA